ncbi:MAG: lipopolysaccharide biosynthesis protein [Myxococcales bacterium]|jgi:stage V sporulation protein B|nr:lipopolysaccharide biosynthesis protein [Myxococcales bacterium]
MTERGDADDGAKRAGRGGLFVLGAKVFFILAGLVQQALLPKALGHAGYGALSRVLAASNILNNVVVASSTQGVSRAVAGAAGNERAAFRIAARVHVPLALAFAVLLLAIAPVVAWYEKAPHIRTPLFVMAGVLGLYGVYAPLVGALNGSRRFDRQAALDITAAALRTVGLVGVGYLLAKSGGSGVLGSVLGAVGAASVVFVVALRWVGHDGRGLGGSSEPSAAVGTPRAYFWGIFPVILAQACTNALMQADILVLGRYLSLSATGPDPVKSADEWVAVYRACQLFAFLPYQLLFSVTQVLFPMIAKVRAEGSPGELTRVVERGGRLGAIVCGLLVSVVVALPGGLLRFAYDPVIAERGREALHVLALAQAAFAILGLGTTILVGIGREITALLITLVALILVLVLSTSGVPRAAFGGPQLLTAAACTAAALLGALAVTIVVVRRATGAFVPWVTGARVSLGVGLAWTLGLYTPTSGRLTTTVMAAGVALLYVVVLVVTRELRGADLALARSIVARKKA